MNGDRHGDDATATHPVGGTPPRGAARRAPCLQDLVHCVTTLTAALLVSGCSIAIGISNSPPLPDNGPPRLHRGGPAPPPWAPIPGPGLN